MRIAITGATGNVGTPLVTQLLADPAGHTVVGIARRLPDSSSDRVSWVSTDLAETSSEADLVTAFAGVDAVVHQAWRIQPSHDPALMRRVNIDGTARVLAAVAKAGVPALLHASSVGAYSPGPKDRAVDESWPTDGIRASLYSRQKAEAERLLDAFGESDPDVRVVRIRPGIVLQRAAGSELARYFLGPLVPRALVRRAFIPVVPDIDRLRIQAVHAEDLAAAYVAALVRPVSGAFNVAADPVLDPTSLARALGAVKVPVPAPALRALISATWRLRVQPTDPGWLDLGLGVPVMSTARARDELGWSPRHPADAALLELIDGLQGSAGGPTPALHGGRTPVSTVLSGIRGIVPGLKPKDAMDSGPRIGVGTRADG